jgi:hypothetical protein
MKTITARIGLYSTLIVGFVVLAIFYEQDAVNLAQQFTRAKADSVEEILEALTSLGLARRLRGGKYAAVK